MTTDPKRNYKMLIHIYVLDKVYGIATLIPDLPVPNPPVSQFPKGNSAFADIRYEKKKTVSVLVHSFFYHKWLNQDIYFPYPP